MESLKLDYSLARFFGILKEVKDISNTEPLTLKYLLGKHEEEKEMYYRDSKNRFSLKLHLRQESDGSFTFYPMCPTLESHIKIKYEELETLNDLIYEIDGFVYLNNEPMGLQTKCQIVERITEEKSVIVKVIENNRMVN